jgi:hypothetical protein
MTTASGELVVGAVQEPFDRLGTEGAVELPCEVGRGGGERELLVDRQVRPPVVDPHQVLRTWDV